MGENKGPKKWVLVVDDEPKILKFIEIKLRASGYEVILATDGQEALKLVKRAKPDIVVLDLLMPIMDGFEVLEKLRAFTKLPVIVLTAKGGTFDRAISLGASDYMAKPFNPDELIRRIKVLLPGS